MKNNKKINLILIILFLIIFIFSIQYTKSKSSYQYSWDNFEHIVNDLPSYSKDNLVRIASKVIDNRNSNTITFEFITDTHYDQKWSSRKTALRHLDEAKELGNMINTSFIVVGGDIIDGYSPKDKSIENLNKTVSELMYGNNMNVFLVKGNHDDNTYYNIRNTPCSVDNVIFPKEFYNCTISKIKNNVEIDNENPYGSYYYKDFPNQKLRVIILNTNDLPVIYKKDGSLKYNGINKYAVSNDQLNWVAHKALNFSDKKDKSKWKVIFFSHVCFEKDINHHKKIINGDAMINIIQSFKNGESYCSKNDYGDFAENVNVDFRKQGKMDVIAMISGHVHKDALEKKDGITYITTLNSVPIRINPNTPIRCFNSNTENAFDVFSIDIKNRNVSIYRFGAGTDRKFSY